jgi:environmental stress-induced protein Ves
MNFEVIKASENKTTNWSGGTTTEIYISPEGSDFQKRNFDFRLSIATVDVEESTFTRLPGVKRTLLVLNGELHLKHECQHEVFLKKYEQDSFLGDWNTKSKGKVTDFNLMCNEKTIGKITPIHIDKNQCKTIQLYSKNELFYLTEGELLFENTIIGAGDLLVMPSKIERIDFFTKSKTASVIHVEIN